MTSDEPNIRERTSRKGYEGLFKVNKPIPTRSQVKCEITRTVKEAQKNKKTRRDYKLIELAHEYNKLFRACVKRKGQEQFHKVEIWKGFLNRSDKYEDWRIEHLGETPTKQMKEHCDAICVLVKRLVISAKLLRY